MRIAHLCTTYASKFRLRSAQINAAVQVKLPLKIDQNVENFVGSARTRTLGSLIKSQLIKEMPRVGV